MDGSQPFTQGNEDLYTSMGEQLNEILKNCKSIDGPIKRYVLNTSNVKAGEKFRREIFGEKDKNKVHKTILLVGETGKGKSTVINAIVNYMLGVKWEKRIWFELIETKSDQTASQTVAVTVYDVFIEESPFSLTIIDTPGYGSTEGPEEDIKVAEGLHELFRSEDGVQEIDAVCLVMSASDKRLSDRLLYVFDSVLSLFGRDVEKNIVILITHCQQKPTNAINAIKKANVRCAETKDKKPVYFKFDNCFCEIFNDDNHSEIDHEECQQNQTSWDTNIKSMNELFSFLNDINSVHLKMTETVLKNRKQLTASITNIKDRIMHQDNRKQELYQTKTALEQNEKKKKEMNDFEFEVDEPYKEKVPIKHKWWYLSKEATCCRICEENCHYPGCWWIRDLSWCSVMSNGKCTVCTGRCDHTNHVKEGKIYELNTRKVKKTYADLKEKYKRELEEKMSLTTVLENEISVLEQERIQLIEKCYECICILDATALKTDCLSTLQHLDYLIEKLREVGRTDKAEELEEVKKKAQSANKGLLRYVTFWKK